MLMIVALLTVNFAAMLVTVTDYDALARDLGKELVVSC
jgi:hypothetical protein